MRCIDDIDIVEDAERFVRVAQEVYKALETLSSCGQFGAFSSERTEWMDHPVQLFPVCCIQDPPFFSVVHRALIPLSVLSMFLQLYGSDCWKVPSRTLVTSTASTRLSKQSQAWLQQSGAEHRGVSERDLQRLGSCELNVQSELVKRTQGLNKMFVYEMWAT